MTAVFIAPRSSPVKRGRTPADKVRMSGPANTPSTPKQVCVTLDSQPVVLPLQLAGSLPAIRAHLEALALSQQRILHVLVVDGVSLNLQKPAWPLQTFHQIAAASISFPKLRFQLVRLAREQVGQLRARAEAAVLPVLINDWHAVHRIWWNLLPDLKEPLVTLSFLPEPGYPAAPLFSTPTAECARQAEELGHIQQEVAAGFASRDAVAISDTLEQRLLPWLDRLGAALEQPHELPQA